MSKHEDLEEIQDMLNALAKMGTNEWNQNNPTGLSVTHVLILQILEQTGPKRPSALAGELQITSGGVTGLTNKLVNEGLIKRNYSEEDRRAILLEITDKGSASLKIAMEHRDQITDYLFRNLTDSDISELKRIFSAILG